MRTLDIVRVRVNRPGFSTKGKLAMIVETSLTLDHTLPTYAIEFISKKPNGMAWFDEDELTYVTSVGELVDRGNR